MITNTILYLFYLFIYGLTAPLRYLSDVSLPVDLTNAIQTTNSYLASINFIFPVSTFLTIFTLILTIEGFIILYKIINWLIRKIPTID
jgi:hypothetical protein